MKVQSYTTRSYPSTNKEKQEFRDESKGQPIEAQTSWHSKMRQNLKGTQKPLVYKLILVRIFALQANNRQIVVAGIILYLLALFNGFYHQKMMK